MDADTRKFIEDTIALLGEIERRWWVGKVLRGKIKALRRHGFACLGISYYD